MKIGRNLNNLAAELTRQTEAKKDYVADTRRLEVVPHDEGVTLDVDSVGSFGITQHAHRQLGDRCGVPAKYYDRMLQDAPDLLANNLNHWLAGEPENRMVRTLDGHARAFLSERYRPLDHYDLAETALPVLVDAKAEVVSCEVTQTRFYLKAIVPGVQEEIGPPQGFTWGQGHHFVDVVQPGIVISNSEIGAGALAVQPAIHTVRCTNLTVWTEGSLRKYHIGRSASNGKKRSDDETAVWQYLSDDTKRLSDAAVWSQVRDLMAAALTGDVFSELVAELRSARSNAIESSPVQAVEVLAANHRLNDDEQQGVLQHLIRGGDLTQYGMHAAITRTAEDVENYDRASELEALGGAVVRLPSSDWAQIAKAT